MLLILNKLKISVCERKVIVITYYPTFCLTSVDIVPKESLLLTKGIKSLNAYHL